MSLVAKIMTRIIPRRMQPAAIDARMVFSRTHDNVRNLQTLAGIYLGHEFAHLSAESGTGSAINSYEMKFHSQNGEDGILLYIFSRIGVTNHRFAEIGGGSGDECNSANLAINYGWTGLLVDGSEQQAALAQLYLDHKLGITCGVQVLHRFVTVDNVNEMLTEHGLRGEIDLLSIDIDGNDYWVWEAITQSLPRVVVIEYNAAFGCTRSATVRYDPSFTATRKHASGLYHGASLPALTKLADRKGYALIGCDRAGVNAFYLRRELLTDGLSEVPVAAAYFENVHRCKTMSTDEQFDRIKNLEYVEI